MVPNANPKVGKKTRKLTKQKNPGFTKSNFGGEQQGKETTKVRKIKMHVSRKKKTTGERVGNYDKTELKKSAGSKGKTTVDRKKRKKFCLYR